MEAGAQVSIFKKATELWVLRCIEGLISCDYPFVKILVELLLIECLALNKGRETCQHTERVIMCKLHTFVSSA